MRIGLKPNDAILIALVLFLIVLSARNILKMVSLILSPYSGDITDGVVYAMRLAYLYKNLNTYPFLITYYPPLSYLIQGAARNALGFANLPFFSTRLVDFIALMLDAIMIYVVAKRAFNYRPLYTIIAPLLFLSSSLITVTSNPVVFELLFDLLAIYFVLKGERNDIILAAISLVIAVLFKQTGLIMFAAISLYLIINKRFWQALLFTVVFAIILGPILLAINAATGGRFFLSVFTIPLLTQASFAQLTPLVLIFLIEAPFLIFLVPIAYMLRNNTKSLITITMVIITLFSIGSAAKYGSGSVYFFAAIAMCCIAFLPMAAFAFGNGRKSISKKSVYKTTIISFFLIMFIYGELYNTTVLFLPIPSNSYEHAVGQYISSIKGNVLIENPNLAIAAGKSLVFESSIFWVLQKPDLWNDSVIINSVCDQNFSAVVMPKEGKDQNTFSYYNGLTAAINHSYHLNTTIDGWGIYLPDIPKSSC